MHYVIVGGGIAGTTAAEELRKLDPDAEITLVSEEEHPVYSRVLLPHYVKGKVPRERVFLKKAEWYDAQNIEWLPGMRVKLLDDHNKFVLLSDGRELPYDKLLLAVGGEVRHLDEDMRGVSHFRTLDDADHMLQLIRELPAGARGAVYGGGFIACEYINIFAHFQIPTTVILKGDRFWSRVLDAESAKLIEQRLIAGHVEIVKGAKEIQLEGTRTLERVKTPSERISCAMLGVGIGIHPELEWIRDAGVEIGKGIRTNAFLETNISDIFAIGDGIEFDDVIVGRPLLAGNWMNAIMQARAVAKTMFGDRTEFRLVSSYATNVLGLEIIFIGDTDPTAADEVKIRGSVAEGGVAQLLTRHGRLVGATLVNRNTDRAWITKAIQEGKGVEKAD